MSAKLTAALMKHNEDLKHMTDHDLRIEYDMWSQEMRDWNSDKKADNRWGKIIGQYLTLIGREFNRRGLQL